MSEQFPNETAFEYIKRLREENERLKKELGDETAATKEAMDTIYKLQSRLSAAEEARDSYLNDLTLFKSRLSTAEKETLGLRNDLYQVVEQLETCEENKDNLEQEYSLLELRLERAETVAKAADRYTDRPSDGTMSDLINSLRHYEEGK